jgi:glycosyltransferase involved in cell wall biosynthesis
MKVLYLVTNFARWEGDLHSPWFVELIHLLRERGVEVEVLAPSYQGLKDQVVYDIPVYRFRYFFSPWETLTHTEGAPNKIRQNPLYLLLVPFYLFSGALSTIRCCRRQQYDIIHVHWPMPQGLFGIVGRWSGGGRLVTTFYGADLALTRRFPLLQPLLKWFVRSSDAVTAISFFTGRQVESMTGVQPMVVPYGVNMPPPREYVPPPPGPKQILAIGRLIERKGHVYLVQALAELAKRRDDVRLTILGRGSERARLESLIDELDLADRVRLLDYVSDEELAELYRQCDAFVQPSITDSGGDFEGLGMVILEAMSYQKPVVATKEGGILDIVHHDETGVLVEERDPQALAQAIEAVLSDKTWARKLGQAGFAYAKDYFSWPRIVDQIVALYSPEIEAASP